MKIRQRWERYKAKRTLRRYGVCPNHLVQMEVRFSICPSSGYFGPARFCPACEKEAAEHDEAERTEELRKATQVLAK